MKKLSTAVVLCALTLALGATALHAADGPVATPTWMTVYGSATFRGAPLEKGDEVRAYTADGLLVGRFTIEKERTEDYGFLPIYGDDTFSPAKDGAVAGEAIRFSLFKANERKEYPLVKASLDAVPFAAKAEETRLDLMF